MKKHHNPTSRQTPPRVLFPADRADSKQDCDCACALDVPRPVNQQSLQGLWQITPGTTVLSDALNDPHWHGVYNSSGPVPVAVLNQPAWDLWQLFEMPQRVDQASKNDQNTEALQALVYTGLLQPISHAFTDRLVQKSETLTAWIHTNNICNLRCDYCYLNKTNSVMSLETGCQAIDAVTRSAVKNGYQGITLKYAGGEPTLTFDLINDLHAHAEKGTNHSGLKLEEVILSNGTRLTQKMIDTMIEQKIRLMISLDGVGDWHDAQRTYLGGKGSFQDVAESIELCLNMGLIPDISVTLSDRNIDGLPETIGYLLDKDLPFSLNFYRENDCSASLVNMQIKEQRMIDALLHSFKLIEHKLPNRSLLGSLVDRASFVGPHAHTCSVGKDYMVIDHHGQVAKCQMEIQNALTNIYVDDPLEVIRLDQAGLQNPHVDEKEGCKDCEWKYWCAGGCSLATYRTTGRYDIKSPNCTIYKAIYPEVLRLEALRLIKRAEQPQNLL